MEAMAMEIPCVSTFVAGIPELIGDGVEGLLVPPSSEQALFTAMERMVCDADLRRNLARAGRRRVLELYDLQQNARFSPAHCESRLRISANQLAAFAEHRLIVEAPPVLCGLDDEPANLDRSPASSATLAPSACQSPSGTYVRPHGLRSAPQQRRSYSPQWENRRRVPPVSIAEIPA